MESDRRRILIVEDDPEMRHLLSVILDQPDREVITTSTGDEARDILEGGEIDLVVLDLILPDIDGRTLLETMRQRAHTASIPVVVISGRIGPGIRQDCYDLGADYFTEKPFEPEQVAADITARLERAGRRESASMQDPVTGLLNRAGLLEGAPDPDTGYSLALVHLDGFSSLSERWGWADAEAVLKEVSGVVGSVTAGRASAARIGGGEFAFLLPDTALDAPAELAGSLLERIRDLLIRDPDGETLRLTTSIGVVVVEPGTSLEESFAAARRRVFQAREAGGNQVVAADPDAGVAKKRVLVAEDDEISATILVHRLQKEGLDIVRYDNGKEAYEAALEDAPNLVILDVKMPGMDGFEVLERLRRMPAYSTVPIILLTSMGSEADVVRGFQLGADDYILKPFSPVELSARVWRLLRRGRSASAV